MGNIDMSINQAIDLTIFTATGTITADEIIEMLESFYQNIPTRLVMWDFRQTNVLDIPSDQLKRIVFAIKQTTHSRVDPKTALVIDNTAMYGMGRMFETFIELEKVPISFNLFSDADSANDWLLE